MEPTPDNGEPRLPNYVIAGAMKSGSSSLRMALSAHPQAFCIGEPHFFCENFDNGVDWYKEQFRLANGAKAVGDKCPDYIFHPEAPERMAELLPDARMIVIVRNPVDRAYSHYWHERRVQHEQLSFEDALKDEPDRLRQGNIGRAYIEIGRYARQLERLASLYPRESIHVLFFEEFRADPGKAYAKVCRFLGIDDSVRPSELNVRHNAYRRTRFGKLFFMLKRYHVFRRLPSPVGSWMHRKLVQPAEYPPLDAGLRVQLDARFADDNAALAKWLGVDRCPW